MKKLVIYFYVIYIFACLILSSQTATSFPDNTSRLLAELSSLPSQFQVNKFQTKKQLFPRIAILKDGNFVTVRANMLQDDSDFGIYAEIYEADGIPYLAEFQVNTNSQMSQTNPSITSLTNGGFVIVWQSLINPGITSLHRCITKMDNLLEQNSRLSHFLRAVKPIHQ